jgi:hypothetical protein
MLGAAIAWRFNWKWSLALILAIELGCLVTVRDNLTLNVLMLVRPSKAIKDWQLGR